MLVAYLIFGGAILGSKEREHIRSIEAAGAAQYQPQTAYDPATRADVIHQSEAAEARQNSDLQAQWHAANANWTGAWVSFWALAGLAVTAYFAYLAWHEAKRSADADEKALTETRAESERQRLRYEAQLRANEAEAEVQAERFERQLNIAGADIAARNQQVENQLKLTREQFAAENRAWLSVRPQIGGPLSYSNNRIAIELVLNVTNEGRSPARQVYSSVRLSALGMRRGGLPSDVKSHRDAIRTVTTKSGDSLFPSQPMKIRWVPTALASQTEPTWRNQPLRDLTICLYGCVDYLVAVEDGTGSSKQTSFLYMLQVDNNGVVSDEDQTVPVNSLSLLQLPGYYLAD